MSKCLGPFSSKKQIKEKLKNYKNGKSIGFTFVSSLKAMGLIPRKNGKMMKSIKYLECSGKRVPRSYSDNVKIHSNLYTNENPKNTIPIKFKTVQNTIDTIEKLKKYLKSKKYPYRRIIQVAQVLEQRTRFMKGKNIQNELSKKFISKLKKYKHTING